MKLSLATKFPLALLIFAVLSTGTVPGSETSKTEEDDPILRAQLSYGFTATTGPLYALDEEAGYTYVPNADITFSFYEPDGKWVVDRKCVVNNMGHLSPRPYSIEKPDSEYRILCLGNSFTATPQNVTQWTTALEDVLSKDEEMKKLTGKSSIRVLNFGLDGTGFVQWSRLYHRIGRDYDPDFVIISFFWNDILRRFVYRDTIDVESESGDYKIMVTSSTLPVDFSNPDCRFGQAFVAGKEVFSGPEKTEQMKREVYWSRMNNLKKANSEVDWSTNPPYSEVQGCHESAAAVRTIFEDHPRVIVLFHPSVQECRNRKGTDLLEPFQEELGDIKIINMLDYLPLDDASEGEVTKWYNLPFDEHPSSYGCQIYAEAVRVRLHDFLKKAM